MIKLSGKENFVCPEPHENELCRLVCWRAAIMLRIISVIISQKKGFAFGV